MKNNGLALLLVLCVVLGGAYFLFFYEPAESIPQDSNTVTSSDDGTPVEVVVEAGAFYGTTTDAEDEVVVLCAVKDCTNKPAISGSSDCCVIHSAECIECGDFISQDATYCADCEPKDPTEITDVIAQ